MLVTLSSPPGAQLRGVVSGIEPGKTLTLRNGKLECHISTHLCLHELTPAVPHSYLSGEREICPGIYDQCGRNYRAGGSTG
jgi:hypothetical protein